MLGGWLEGPSVAAACDIVTARWSDTGFLAAIPERQRREVGGTKGGGERIICMRTFEANIGLDPRVRLVDFPHLSLRKDLKRWAREIGQHHEGWRKEAIAGRRAPDKHEISLTDARLLPHAHVPNIPIREIFPSP